MLAREKGVETVLYRHIHEPLEPTSNINDTITKSKNLYNNVSKQIYATGYDTLIY